MGPQKKNIISFSLFLSLSFSEIKDLQTLNFFFSESEKGGVGGSQKSKLKTSKTTQ
jgi:hypothetical protein